MEKEYLIEGLIAVVILLVMFLGFLAFFPEARNAIKDFSTGILGLGFAKSPEQVKASVKFIRDSFDSCSQSQKVGCICDVNMDILPSDYKLIINNEVSESNFILVNPDESVESSVILGGRKVGVPVVAFDGSSWNAYCNFDNLVMQYDSGWKYKSGSSDVKLVPLDDVSLHPVMKLEDGNFCLFDEALLGVEKGENEKGEPLKAGKTTNMGKLPLVDGVFSKYYSGKEFYNLKKKVRCNALKA